MSPKHMINFIIGSLLTISRKYCASCNIKQLYFKYTIVLSPFNYVKDLWYSSKFSKTIVDVGNLMFFPRCSPGDSIYESHTSSFFLCYFFCPQKFIRKLSLLGLPFDYIIGYKGFCGPPSCHKHRGQGSWHHHAFQ